MADRGGRRGRPARRVVGVGCVIAAGVAVGVGVWQEQAPGAPAYRLGRVTVASVARTLDVSATLQPADEAPAAFQVAGTVASVTVTQGQKVAAGQIMATLDPTLLQSQVNAARAALTAAQAKLSADESGQATASPAGTAAAVGTAATAGTTAEVQGRSDIILTSATRAARPGGGGGTGSSGGTATGSGSLASDQQAVVTAQHTADLDLQTAGADLTRIGAACTTAPPTRSPERPTTTTEPTSTTTSTTTATTDPSPTSTTGPSTSTTSPAGVGPTTPAADNNACAVALSQAGTAEKKVGYDQASLASAESALASLLSSQAAASAAPASPAGTAGGGTRRTTTGGSLPAGSAPGVSGSPPASTGSRSAGSSPAAQPTDTPARLAGDQATIDSDQASLTAAEQSLSAASLTSPISGTVAFVGIAAGQTVGAGSSTAVITVINSSGYQTTASLTTAQVQQVRVGDRAQLTVDGAAGTLDGVVSAIGPVDASNSSYTYPVTVAVTSAAAQVAVGSATRIRIEVAHTGDVRVVPTSAVHTTGPGASFVYLDRAGRETRQPVTVGVVGPVYTQITSGLSRSEAVVLADPSRAVPASSTNLTTTGRRGVGRFLRGAAAGSTGAIGNLLRGAG